MLILLQKINNFVSKRLKYDDFQLLIIIFFHKHFAKIIFKKRLNCINTFSTHSKPLFITLKAQNMLFIVNISLFLGSIYVILLSILLFFWYKIPHYTSYVGKIFSDDNTKTYLSVIISLRNEQSHVKNLIDSLLLQTFPRQNFQIILVNDHSTDATLELLKTYTQSYAHFTLLNLPIGLAGKKQAITYAISQAQGELIVSTDADCLFHKDWLSTIYDFYRTKNAKFISAAVAIIPQPHTPNTIFQILDLAALINVGAACINIGKPTMCNGANLAYSKKAFEEVQGFQGNNHIASGDDEFLLQKITTLYPKDVYFLKSQNTIVRTQAQLTWRDLFLQRCRWASKWKLHKQWNVKLLAIFIFLFHTVSLLLPILYWNNYLELKWFAIFWLGKISIEFLFVGSSLYFLQLSQLTAYIPISSLFYPFYALFIGIFANFKGFTWKDRFYK
jgi:cellulose synthase/poly-beta-1,6-N-acetylglucosamine synthase-like glycosyltransferase